MHSIYLIKTAVTYFLLVAALIGHLAPISSALLAEVVPGFRTVIICTGSEKRLLILGASNSPVEIEELDHQQCLTTNLPDTGSVHTETRLAEYSAWAQTHGHTNPWGKTVHLSLLQPSRAPPALQLSWDTAKRWNAELTALFESPKKPLVLRRVVLDLAGRS